MLPNKVLNKIKNEVLKHYKQWKSNNIYMLVTDYRTLKGVFSNFDKLLQYEIKSTIEYYKDNYSDYDNDEEIFNDISDFVQGNIVLSLDQDYYIDDNYNYYPKTNIKSENIDYYTLLSKKNMKKFKNGFISPHQVLN